MIEKVRLLDEEDQKYYASDEFKSKNKDDQIDDRIDRILDKIDFQLEDAYSKKGLGYETYCDKSDPFYETCRDLLGLRIEEIIHYMNQGWSDAQIVDLYKVKIPTTQAEYDAMSDKEFEELLRFQENISEPVVTEETPAAEYSEILGDLWKRIMFCIVGWAIACIGFVMMGNSTLTGMLVVMVGAVIVEFPCYKILLAGGSLTTLIASAFKDQEVTYKYSDGSTRKGYESNAPARLIITIIGFVITLFIGAIIVVFKIFKDFFKLMRIPADQRGINSWKEQPWAPIVVGISAFILGIIIAAIASSILVAAELNRDDYTSEEKVVMIDGLIESVNKKDFAYSVKPYYDEAGNYLFACEVKHDSDGNNYYMAFDAQGKKDFGMSADQYMRVDGVWHVYDEATKKLTTAPNAKEIEQLEKLTLEGIIVPEKLKENISKVKARITDDFTATKVIMTYRGGGNANKENLEIHLEIREGTQGPNYSIIEIKYPYSYEADSNPWLQIDGENVNIKNLITE